MATTTTSVEPRTAQTPFAAQAHLLAVRGGSRLLHVDATAALHDRWFSDLPTLLRPDDLLVMNDTRVIKARLFGTKDSGGKVELLVERVTGEFEALAFIRASHAPRPGSSRCTTSWMAWRAIPWTTREACSMGCR